MPEHEGLMSMPRFRRKLLFHPGPGTACVYGSDFAALLQEIFCVAAGTAAVVQDFCSRIQFVQEAILYGAEVYGYGVGDEFFCVLVVVV